MADSLKLASGGALVGLVAGTAWLSRLPWPSAETAAFVLYFVWPLLSVVVLCLTSLFAIRDFQHGKKVQAALAILVAVGVVGVAFARFHGWE